MEERSVDNAVERTVSGAPDTWPLSARDAATLLGVSERTVRRAISRGALHAVERGGVLSISREDIARFRARRSGTNRARPSPGAARARSLANPGGESADTPALPRASTRLVGRSRELIELKALVLDPDVSLVTLTGPGGVGKTRLALACAGEITGDFPDGVWFVNLAPINSPSHVLSAIAQTLGFRQSDETALLDRLTTYLHDKRGLLVLDNFEQVIEAAPIVSQLLKAAGDLSVIVTSRVRLRLSGEREWPVPPLTLPDLDAPFKGDAIARSEAVRLFADRARAVQPGFELTEANTGSVAEICRRLDGLPLAIELAAARVKMLPPPALLNRLERRLPLLTGGGRDLPERQQTMRDAVAWSHDLLSPDERDLFERLAVFVGGFTLDAAEAVCGFPEPRADESEATDALSPVPGYPPASVLDGVASLLDKSLVRQESSSGGEPRFGMLEIVREFGLERLDARGERDGVSRRHAAHFLAVAEMAEPGISGGNQVVWLDRLDDDHDNLRTAFNWFSETGLAEECLGLAVACAPYWYVRGHIREAWARLNRVLEMTGPDPTPAKGSALNWICQLAMTMGDLPTAAVHAHQELIVWRAIGDPRGGASALHTLGMVEEHQFHWDAAEALYEEELAIWRQLDEARMIGRALALLGGVVFGQGDTDRAIALVNEAAAHLREGGDRHWEALCAWYLGMFEAARDRFPEAAQHYRESLRQLIDIGDSVWRFKPLVGLAATAAALGHADEAGRLLGAVDSLLQRTGARLLPFDRPIYEHAEATSRTLLVDTGFAAAHAEGRDLFAQDLLVLADFVVTAAESNAHVPTSHHKDMKSGLTAREHDVLRLLAQGMTNTEVAESLFISRRTVDTHVGHILDKLDTSSRRKAVSRARDLGLLSD